MAADRPRRGAGKASSLALKDKAQIASAARHTPHQNHLLAALPTSDYQRLAAHLELVPMKLGEVLYESGGHCQLAALVLQSLHEHAER